MPFIGNSVTTQGFAPAVDYFNGDGVTVTFTLSRPVASVAQLTAVIDNVIQNPSSAFTVSGNAITFTSAPLSGTNNIWVEYTSLVTTYAAISQDPSVIGDITASGGYLSTGDFGNSYIDGTIVDYVTGNSRITTGPADGLTIYNGGTTARTALTSWSSTGNVGVGVTPSSWSTGKAIETGGNGCGVWGLASGTTYYNAGYYYNSADKFAITGSYALYSQLVPADGSFRWLSSTATGTAGNTATMTEKMRITSNGYVNIGAATNTTNKVNVLLSGTAISGNTTGSAVGAGDIFQLVSNNWGTTNSTTFLLGGGDSSTVGQICSGIGFSRESDADWGTQLRFYTHQSATDVLDSLNERMRITSDGSVRIACENYANTPSSTNWGVSINNTGAGSRFFGQGTGTETQIEFGKTR